MRKKISLSDFVSLGDVAYTQGKTYPTYISYMFFFFRGGALSANHKLKVDVYDLAMFVVAPFPRNQFFAGLIQMRSSLKDQLSLEELREEFAKFAGTKVARELPDFYKACLDREEIPDFFERQAVTTAIIDR